MTTDRFDMRKIAVPAFGPSFLFGLGEGAILPVIALGARELGGSVALAALIVTLIGIGSLVTNIPASMITTRYGERWAIVGAALWGALGMALCVLDRRTSRASRVGIFMVGMSTAVFSLARQSYLTETVPFRYRARALSTLGGVMRIGLFLGPFVAAGLIHAIGIGGAYWARRRRACCCRPSSRCACPTCRRTPRPAPPRSSPARPARPRRCRSVGATLRRSFSPSASASLLVAAVRASRQAVIPLWAESIGLDAATTSLIYGLAGGIDMLVFYPAGKVMDRRGRAWVAVPSMLIMGGATDADAVHPQRHDAAARRRC